MGSRRTQIESIVLGTLLFDGTASAVTDGVRDNYKECQCITPDMFSDELDGRIFSTIRDMHRAGITTTGPLQILEFNKSLLSADFLPHCCSLMDNDFEVKKMCYNAEIDTRKIYYFLNPSKAAPLPPYTTVNFSDYVTALIKIVYSNAKQ